MKKNNKGFTLAELLIVVAIIAVLVAVAIPVFTTQLEKSRDATTVANLRSAYAEAQTAYLMYDGKSTSQTLGKATITAANGVISSVAVSDVVAKGAVAGWEGDIDKELPFTAPTDMGGTPKTYTVTFNYDATTGQLSSVTAA